MNEVTRSIRQPDASAAAAQRAPGVAAVVVVGDVVARPQRLIGRHGHQQLAPGLCDAAQLAQGDDVVRRVLDHVEACDQVERLVVERELFEPGDRTSKSPRLRATAAASSFSSTPVTSP